jgi:hypothetical protein
MILDTATIGVAQRRVWVTRNTADDPSTIEHESVSGIIKTAPS